MLIVLPHLRVDLPLGCVSRQRPPRPVEGDAHGQAQVVPGQQVQVSAVVRALGHSLSVEDDAGEAAGLGVGGAGGGQHQLAVAAAVLNANK